MYFLFAQAKRFGLDSSHVLETNVNNGKQVNINACLSWCIMNKSRLIKQQFKFLLSKGFQYDFINDEGIVFKYHFNMQNICVITLFEDYRRDHLALRIEKPIGFLIFQFVYQEIENHANLAGVADLKNNIHMIREKSLAKSYSLSDLAFIETVEVYKEFVKNNIYIIC